MTVDRAASDARSEGDDAAGGTAAPIDKAAVLGHAVYLFSVSRQHKGLFLADLDWALVPPIALGQFRLWRDGHKPVGFATWAFLSDEAAARFDKGHRRIAPQEWRAGRNLRLVDLVTPFGGEEQALAELKQLVFSGEGIEPVTPGEPAKPEGPATH